MANDKAEINFQFAGRATSLKPPLFEEGGQEILFDKDTGRYLFAQNKWFS